MRGVILSLLVILSLVAGQEVVEISGSSNADTDDTQTGGAEPIEVTAESSNRHIRYDVPDDGLLPNWCASDGKACPSASPDIGAFQLHSEQECLHKCRELSCMGALHADGVCSLSSTSCTPDQLVDSPGGRYYQRQAAGDGSTPVCPGGTGPVGVDVEWPSNQYCKGVGVECPGPTLAPPRFRPTIRQCLIECNVHPACMSAHYRDKLCYRREHRCDEDELVPRPGGIDFYRLRKGQECPPERPPYVEENYDYTGKFCMAWGKTCKGHNLYPRPWKLIPFQKCLQKCVKIRSCGSVDFYNNRCYLKDYRCKDEELEQDPNSQNFMRLQEGEDCPGNRKPPSEEAPWSERFCYKKDWNCPGNDLEAAPLPAADFIECLRKCVEATGCEAIQFIEGQCFLKSKTCEVDEREQQVGTNMYYRLREGDECTEDTSPPECPPHSSYMPEYSSCPVTCDDQNPDKCDTIYQPGCVCDDGFAQHENGTCVPLETCGCREHDGTKREIASSWVSADCQLTYYCVLDSENKPSIEEEERGCGDLQTCDGAGKCICVDGYKWNEESEECVPIIECGPHSSYEPSGLPCSDTCDHPNKEAECTEAPGAVCHCNEGYILDKEDGTCVPYSECGCRDENQNVIPVGTEWLSSDCLLSYSCNEKMDELPEVVTITHECGENAHCQELTDMPKAACFCDVGYNRHVDDTCQPGVECEAPTVFAGAPPATPSTCRQPHLEKSSTTTGPPGCVCPEGMLLDDDHDCIPAESCPCYDENGFHKQPGDVWITNDCSALINCTHSHPGHVPHQKSSDYECQENAVCDMTSGFPQCVCGEGFTPAVDGISCVPDEPPCEETLRDRIETFVTDVMGIVSGGCGSCSDTCRNPHASKMCAAKSRICKCPAENYLYDEVQGKCIHANECGCYDVHGEHRLAGTNWLNNDCTKRLSCEAEGEGAPVIKETLYSCPTCDGYGNCLNVF